MMLTYLERYQNGECVRVWEELIALGEGIHQAPTYEDARAVARETMARARRNIETLYQRLKTIGYQFVAEPSDNRRKLENSLDQMREQFPQNPLLDSVFGNMLNNVELLREQIAQFRDAHPETTPRRASGVITPPPDDISQRIDAFEVIIGKLPLSVRAWGEMVGNVNFMGEHPGLASMEDAPFSTSSSDKPSEWYGDPLCFRIDLDADEAQVLIEYRLDNPPIDENTFEMVVGPDCIQKAGFSGGAYSIVLPDARADTMLHGTDLHFVAYLRESFLWGGFPGLKDDDDRDDDLITYLKDGLEPI
jgi:hypothetical protein